MPAHPHRAPGSCEFPDQSCLRFALEQTLSIATAETESQLVAHTLAAACEVTGAQCAAALDPDGTACFYGDAALAAALTRMDLTALPDGTITTPAILAVRFADTLIVAASMEPAQLCADAHALLALVVAHALATRSRLREVDQLSRQAEIDPLTGLRHNRPFVRRLNASSPGRTAIIAVDVDDFTGRDTLQRADKALYQAKRAGRDTARLAPSRAHAA